MVIFAARAVTVGVPTVLFEITIDCVEQVGHCCPAVGDVIVTVLEAADRIGTIKYPTKAKTIRKKDFE